MEALIRDPEYPILAALTILSRGCYAATPMEIPREFTDWILELIRRTAVDLPADVEEALTKAAAQEQEGSPARGALQSILANVRLAREHSTPICQDTGTNIFYVYLPAGCPTLPVKQSIEEAVRRATAASFLRPNAVDPLTGKNSGDGVGKGLPYVHFEQWEKPEIRVRLMLKGGGCENVGAQYSLPDAALCAGRDLRGVEIAVLDAIAKAQGKGCAPGVIGVCIGGDRGTGYLESKMQLFRKLDDRNPVLELAELESRVRSRANSLGIGPMGFGGKTTSLGVKVGVIDRIPASFFVTVSYMCWACRRREMMVLDGGMEID